MTKPLLDRSQDGPLEHFDDEIRAFRSSARYMPTPLISLLYELAGHRCTICCAPWLEIHHIDELGDGGKTEYENLIVLCPNCHTRVHAEGVPSKEELRHYKAKLEIAYELPVLSRLTTEERALLREVAAMSAEDQIVFSRRFNRDVAASSQDEAVQVLKKEVGHFQLQEFGMVSVDFDHAIMSAEAASVNVALRVKVTGKGVKWVRYLKETGRVPAN
jgi:HNH endonuclease